MLWATQPYYFPSRKNTVAQIAPKSPWKPDTIDPSPPLAPIWTILCTALRQLQSVCRLDCFESINSAPFAPTHDASKMEAKWDPCRYSSV